MADVLELTGPIHVGPEDVVDRAWVIDGRITFSRPSGDHAVTTIEGHVLPGLVDAHCHIGLVAEGPASAETAEQQALAGREAGTLLVRDAGSPSDTRWIDDRDDLPRVIRAGQHIARTKRYLRNFAHEIEPEDLAAYMRAEARRGDGWVKIVGDWIDRSVGDLAPCWPAEAISAGIGAAHEEGARVTAHCFGEECLPDLIAAGIDGIEHGTGLTEATMEAAAAQQVAVVPTLINIATFPHLVEPARGRFDTWVNHMLALHDRRYETIHAAAAAGVPIYAGTDAGSAMPHGLIVDELAELVAAGFTPAQSLDAGCWAAREWLDRPGLAEGESADLLVCASDPREDLQVLREATVVLRGRVYG
ncbi:MAG: amidohydrolase family protein [Actinomycetales bacterium]